MSKLDVHNKHFMLFISVMPTKEIEVLIDSTLKRPPLFNGDLKFKRIDLKFKVKIPENVKNQIMLSPVVRDQLFEIQTIQLRSNIPEHVQLEKTNISFIQLVQIQKLPDFTYYTKETLK